MYDLIIARKDKYKIAVNYCKQILENKELLLKALDAAEKCAKVAEGYKTNGVIDKGNLPPNLTPEVLFGISATDKAAQFDEIIAVQEKSAKDIQENARKCLEGSKKVKKQAEIGKLRDMASKLITQVNIIKKTANQLKEQKENPWAAPPEVKSVITKKMEPKISEDIDENEFQVEIPESESLQAAELKCVKVKIVDAENKELVSHYFFPNADNVSNLQIPE